MSKIWIDNYANDDGGFTKQRRYSVETGNQSDYQKFLSSSTSEYPYRAGCDLSVLFMPYETDYTNSGQRLPRFQALTQSDAGYGDDEIGVEELHIWELNHDADEIYATTNQIELDSISDIVSGPDYRGNTANIRSTKSIRGVGLRLPMIGVGWGYDINGNPVPSGLNGSGFLHSTDESEVDFEYGWQVDPRDYIAAPIDIRYDSRRKVWTTGADTTSDFCDAYGLDDICEVFDLKNEEGYLWNRFSKPSGYEDTEGVRFKVPIIDMQGISKDLSLWFDSGGKLTGIVDELPQCGSSSSSAGEKGTIVATWKAVYDCESEEWIPVTLIGNVVGLYSVECLSDEELSEFAVDQWFCDNTCEATYRHVVSFCGNPVECDIGSSELQIARDLDGFSPVAVDISADCGCCTSSSVSMESSGESSPQASSESSFDSPSESISSAVSSFSSELSSESSQVSSESSQQSSASESSSVGSSVESSSESLSSTSEEVSSDSSVSVSSESQSSVSSESQSSEVSESSSGSLVEKRCLFTYVAEFDCSTEEWDFLPNDDVTCIFYDAEITTGEWVDTDDGCIKEYSVWGDVCGEDPEVELEEDCPWPGSPPSLPIGIPEGCSCSSSSQSSEFSSESQSSVSESSVSASLSSESSISESSVSSEEASSVSSEGDDNRCLFEYSAVWNCDTEEWDINQVEATCVEFNGSITDNEWLPDVLDDCAQSYYIWGQSCETTLGDCDLWPSTPSAPESPPTGCCSSSSMSSSLSSASSVGSSGISSISSEESSSSDSNCYYRFTREYSCESGWGEITLVNPGGQCGDGDDLNFDWTKISEEDRVCTYEIWAIGNDPCGAVDPGECTTLDLEDFSLPSNPEEPEDCDCACCPDGFVEIEYIVPGSLRCDEDGAFIYDTQWVCVKATACPHN